MIDLSIRVKNPNVWEVRAKELGLMDEVVTTPAVLDDDGAEVTPAETDWVWKKGVYVDPIETVYVEKPTYDSEGTQTSPGSKAPGQHFNIRITNPELEAYFKSQFEPTAYDQHGYPSGGEIHGAPEVSSSNKSEKARVWKGVEFVDMSTVATPQRVWL